MAAVDNLQEFVSLLDRLDVDHVRIVQVHDRKAVYLVYTSGLMWQHEMRELDEEGYDVYPIAMYRAAYDNEPAPLSLILSALLDEDGHVDCCYLVRGRNVTPPPDYSVKTPPGHSVAYGSNGAWLIESPSYTGGTVWAGYGAGGLLSPPPDGE